MMPRVAGLGAGWERKKLLNDDRVMGHMASD